VLPRRGDPRLRLSIVTLSLFVVGIGWLEFRLSIPQILAALLTAALIELPITLRRSSTIVWPASALQTASSTALILRVEGTSSGDLWTTHGWYYFAGVSALGLATKHVVRYQGRHVFNPSNIALVVAFIVLGSGRIEPLDLWWGPLDVPMVIAYAIIVVGGIVICRPLRLIEMGVAFWLTLAVGMGVLAALDHSITARWSFAPIAGTHFWWVVMTSPEILIFMLFMLTDPRTVPVGRTARIAFAVLVGVVASLLIAPWQTEFGAKVGLLSSLAVVSAAHLWLRRVLPSPADRFDDPRLAARRLLLGDPDRREGGSVVARTAVVVGCIGVFVAAVAAASVPARVTSGAGDAPIAVEPIDATALPTIEIDRFVANFSDQLATQEGARELAVTLARNLAVEHEALRRRDPSLLIAVDHGYRLDDLERTIIEAGPDGTIRAPMHEFETLRLMVVFPGGAQEGPNAGFVVTGSLVEVEYSAAGDEIARRRSPFEVTFALRQTTSGAWQITDTLPVPK
jgi:hypothetical protein